MSLSSLLPAPKNIAPQRQSVPIISSTSLESSSFSINKTKDDDTPSNAPSQNIPIPPYGSRKGWMPRSEADFNGGGAYPEIHVTQFPLRMGRKDERSSNSSAETTNTLALTVSKEGQVNYDQIVRQGQRKDKIIYSKYTDLIESSKDPLEKPSLEQEQKIIQETKQALERKMNVRIGAASGGASQSANTSVIPSSTPNDTTFFRYTPANGDQETRIVRMVEAPIDPLEPARFHNKKMPARPPSPPVTIMHSPNKKLTKQDVDNWRIVPCVSNWENPKGYTIPLDKRLAADGRGLQQVQIHSQFANFSEALYAAEQKARQQIEDKARLQKMILVKQNEEHEDKLRALAQKARHARIGGVSESHTSSSSPIQESSSSSSSSSRQRTITNHLPTTHSLEQEQEEKRNQLRQERAKQRIRENNSHISTDRDITERIALGQVRATNAQSDAFDTRLYDHSSGLDSGYGADDSYNLYDRPLTSGSSVNQLYKHRSGSEFQAASSNVDSLLNGANERFTSAAAFQGADKSARDGMGPVQFERDEGNVEQDPFQLGEFMNEVGKKKRPFDHIGKSGFMKANAGSGTGGLERDSKRSKIAFEPSSSNNK
ncbi:SNW domain-containing protein [Acrasis kona]|uniref:SNW domain-containing protein n=1 Tax=Acrasis kona TaxID=1008807 RepID=A0AAW2YNA4_9EUKA